MALVMVMLPTGRLKMKDARMPKSLFGGNSASCGPIYTSSIGPIAVLRSTSNGRRPAPCSNSCRVMATYKLYYYATDHREVACKLLVFLLLFAAYYW